VSREVVNCVVCGGVKSFWLLKGHRECMLSAVQWGSLSVAVGGVVTVKKYFLQTIRSLSVMDIDRLPEKTFCVMKNHIICRQNAFKSYN